MATDWNCVRLLIAVLNLLDEKAKSQITRALDHRVLDRAIHDMIAGKLFPAWFSKEFHLDPLYGTLDGLRQCLSMAAANGLLRMDGTYFDYHPDLSERVTDELLAGIPFEKREARKLGRTLNTFLTDAL